MVARGGAKRNPWKRISFAEIAEPFSREFDESGMTEEELDALVHQVREEIWQEKQCQPLIVKAIEEN